VRIEVRVRALASKVSNRFQTRGAELVIKGTYEALWSIAAERHSALLRLPVVFRGTSLSLKTWLFRMNPWRTLDDWGANGSRVELGSYLCCYRGGFAPYMFFRRTSRGLVDPLGPRCVVAHDGS
jgi:hypothetical protein